MVGISLHIGKNRIVRRILNTSVYQAQTGRDRFAGLTKERPATGLLAPHPREVVQLKHLGKVIGHICLPDLMYFGFSPTALVMSKLFTLGVINHIKTCI